MTETLALALPAAGPYPGERRLTVLHFSNALVLGGAERHLTTLLIGLDRRFFRPVLACPPALLSRIGAALPADLARYPLLWRHPGQFGAAVRLARLLRRERVDVLHSHLFYASALASPLGRRCGVPLIVETPHLRESWRRGWKAHYGFDRWVARSVDAFIAVSRANAAYLTEEKRLPPEKVRVIENGVDLAAFDPSHPPPPGLATRVGIRAGDPVVAIIGRLEEQKGHDLLLTAVAGLRAEFPRLHLLVLGEGSRHVPLEAQAHALGLDSQVHFLGFRANVADWLALADFTVLPSRFEGMPLAAIESLAAGRPVVATAVDGTPEVVADGRTGFIVPAGDIAALGEAMARLLRDPQMRLRFGREGCQRARARFGRDRQIHATEALYLSAWQSSGRGRRLGGTPTREPSVRP